MHKVVFILAFVFILGFLILTWNFPGLLLNLDKGKGPARGGERILLSKKTSKKVVKRVYEMKKKWTDHNMVLKTLGKASYLFKDRENTRSLRENNEMLRANFSEIYDQILEYFKKKYPEWNVKYRPSAPLPGFHIFSSGSGWFSWPVASLHVDRQYQHVDFKKSELPDYKGTISFTIPLQIPEGGTGLYLWEAKSEDRPWYAVYGGPGLAWWLNGRPRKYIDYVVPGQIIEHGGNKFHMISPTTREAKKDRITIQGHGVYTKKDNTLWLYW